MAPAMMLGQKHSKLPVTEAHPKAARWMLGKATKAQKVAGIAAKVLTKYFDSGTHAMTTDHERDAALGALTAWAMLHGVPGWKDIRALDPDAGSPLAAPLGYWVPVAT